MAKDSFHNLTVVLLGFSKSLRIMIKDFYRTAREYMRDNRTDALVRSICSRYSWLSRVIMRSNISELSMSSRFVKFVSHLRIQFHLVPSQQLLKRSPNIMQRWHKCIVVHDETQQGVKCGNFLRPWHFCNYLKLFWIRTSAIFIKNTSLVLDRGLKE